MADSELNPLPGSVERTASLQVAPHAPETLRLMVLTDSCPRPLPMPGKKPRWSKRSWDKWLETGGKR